MASDNKLARVEGGVVIARSRTDGYGRECDSDRELERGTTVMRRIWGEKGSQYRSQ